MKAKIIHKMKSFFKWFYAPLAQNPILFVLVVICCASVPLTANLSGGRYLHYLLYTFLGGSFLAWLVCRLSKTWLKVTVAILFMAVAIIESFHYILLNKCFDPTTLSLILNTNSSEIRGFFFQFFTPGLTIALLGVVIISAALAVVVGRSHLKLPESWYKVLSLPLFIAVCAGVFGMVKMSSIFRCHTYEELIVWEAECGDNPDLNKGSRALMSDPVTKVAYLLIAEKLYTQNFRLWSDLQHQLFEEYPESAASEDSINVVVVIGESFIRSHSSLYGYHMPVNPGLERELRDSALIVFTDAVAPANFTVVSLSNILNLNSVSRHENWWESTYLALAYKKAGWNVEMYSNQNVPGSVEDLSKVVFDKLAMDSIYSRYGSQRYKFDGDLISALPSTDFMPDRRTLTFIHLNGQHFPPSLQVPETSRHPFTADDIPNDKPWLTPDRRAVVADYANATLYNDSVMTCIIDRYRNKPTLLMYFSDHGEEMWDVAPNGHRTRQYPDNPEWIHNMHDVPLFFWMSPSLRKQRPELETALRQAAERPVAMDQIGHTLLGAFAPDSPWYRPELDVTSPDYQPLPRITVQGYSAE